MTTLSTHVLDVSRGVPVTAVGVTLYRVGRGERALIAEARTDGDGRIAFSGTPLLQGTYELVFAVGPYLQGIGAASFYDDIPVRIRIDADNSKHHVPLLLAPYGYSTYRGS
jgi:5-hydroxyisourate hydrolase